MGRVPDQDAPSGVWRVHPLVRIEGDRIGPFDAREQRPEVVGQHGRPPVRRVDVEPQAFVLADVGELIERVDRSRGHRPRCADQRDGQTSGAPVGPDGLAELVGPHPEVLTDLDLSDGVVAEPEHVGGPIRGDVDLLRGVQNERRPRRHASVADIPRGPHVPRRFQRDEVRHGPPGDQQPPGRRGEPELVGEPPDEGQLDFCARRR